METFKGADSTKRMAPALVFVSLLFVCSHNQDKLKTPFCKPRAACKRQSPSKVASTIHIQCKFIDVLVIS